MSYDISLYDRNFLKRAIETHLGDWTGADPIPKEAVLFLITVAAAEGFKPVPLNEDFAAFVREQGAEPSQDYQLSTPELLAQLVIHAGEMAFTIPYGPRAEASIVLCAGIARRVASECGLGFYDPQEGAAVY